MIQNTQSKICTHIFQSIEDQVFALNANGIYLFFNQAHHQAFFALFGQSLELGETNFFNLVQADRNPELTRAFQLAAEGKRSDFSGFLGLNAQNRVWLELTLNPLKKMEPGAVAVFARDVSKTKALEEELRAAKETAQADARAKSAFLSSMSHEIRTPMNAILGLTELLLNKKLDENSIENLKAIRFSANNLLTIINDILDLSKIEAGKFSFETQTFDFFHVLEELNKSITVSAQNKNLLYEINVSGAIPKYLRGDSVRLSQILLNLLGNSLKFTQTGKVQLVVEVVSETETGIILEFKVLDTGIGIPKDQLQNIFQSFTQVHKNQRFKTQGTGLGLSITKRLVEMQDGEIRVESEVGKGSIFSFKLPFLKAGLKDFQQQIEAEEGIEISRFSQMKVLLVEDNKINQLLARQILTGWGVNVEVANDGFEAIAKLQRRTFDLILLDLQMPEIDGFEVARFVRKTIKPPANQIPIVALTADAFTETKELTREAGMNDFITKPYQQKDLFRVIRKFSVQDQELLDWQDLLQEEELENQLAINFEFVKEKFGKDPETFRYILDVFVNDIRLEIDNIRLHFKNNDSLAAVKPVHKLVSTFTAMGMPDTAFNLSLIERLLKQGEEEGLIQEKWLEVERDYENARSQVIPVLESLPV